MSELPPTPDTTEVPPAPAWPPVQTPERAEYVRRAILAIATAVVDSMLAGLSGDDSTADTSLADRTMLRIVRPYLPRMRGVFLSQLADADPAGLERLTGAVATTIEQILAEAPGEPLDRWRYVWEPGAPTPTLVPDVWSTSTRVSTPASSDRVDTAPGPAAATNGRS